MANDRLKIKTKETQGEWASQFNEFCIVLRTTPTMLFWIFISFARNFKKLSMDSHTPPCSQVIASSSPE